MVWVFMACTGTATCRPASFLQPRVMWCLFLSLSLHILIGWRENVTVCFVKELSRTSLLASCSFLVDMLRFCLRLAYTWSGIILAFPCVVMFCFPPLLSFSLHIRNCNCFQVLVRWRFLISPVLLYPLFSCAVCCGFSFLPPSAQLVKHYNHCFILSIRYFIDVILRWR